MNTSSRLLALTALVCLTPLARAQFRFFFAYGDTDLATLQTKNYAGISNPAATLGSEIPENAPLKVWKGSEGRAFKVSVMVVRTGGNASSVYAGGSVLATYDRVAASSSTVTYTNESTFLDKKLVFAGPSIAGSFSNYAMLPAFYADGSIYDNEGDGDQDLLTLQPLSRNLRPQFTGNTDSPRRGGLATAFAMPPSANYQVGYTPVRLFDLTLRSNLAPFETYNGLSLHVYKGTTGNPNTGSSCWIGPSNNPNSMGTTLTVQAVPEPGTAAAILAGLAALGLRRRSK